MGLNENLAGETHMGIVFWGRLEVPERPKMIVFGICICICISGQKISEIEGAVDFCWICARCHEPKILGAILGQSHWIPIDLPCELSIQNVILHLPAKTEGNRMGRRSLLNPCWIPAETLAYFRYIEPNHYVLKAVLLAQDMSSTCKVQSKMILPVVVDQSFFKKNDNALHIMISIMKNSKTFVKRYPTCPSCSY